MQFRWLKIFVFLVGILFSEGMWAQQKYCVYFNQKDLTNFDPSTYFDQKALERRAAMGIAIDETDYPVKEEFVSTLASLEVEIRIVSRWLNAVVCVATEEQMAIARKFPFVAAVELLEKPVLQVTGSIKGLQDLSSADTELLSGQTERMGVRTFHDQGITGKGVRVAIFDIGFESYKTNPSFEHIRQANRIIKTWDFVKKRENVDGYNTHGCFVLSCIAGKIEGVPIGLATDAEFLLARTETWTEFFSEEEQWLAAAEWSDKNGADIINSSLGYTYHRYFPEDMHGKKSLVAKAANMAARKGILVVNSAGNEGDGNWKIIGTPADADSVLSIGGISPWTGYHTSFSSFGPTRDKRMKPNVTAYGHVIGAGPGGLSQTQGTSFSGPLVAGFAACVLQVKPGIHNMDAFREIEKSGDLYPYYDYAHGYGVPQASYFFKTSNPVEAKESLIEFVENDARIEIRINDIQEIEIPDFNEDVIEDPTENQEIPEAAIDSTETEQTEIVVPEVEPPAEEFGNDSVSAEYEYPDEVGVFKKCPDYVFYHIENSRGYLDKYYVVDPQPNFAFIFNGMKNNNKKDTAKDDSPLVIHKADFARPFTIRVYYKGEIKTYHVK